MHQRQKLSLQPHHGQLGIHPCMVLRLSTAFYHFILLPRLPHEQLIDIARTQVRFNRFECILILGPWKAWYFGVTGGETELSSTSQGGIITGGTLKPCIVIEDNEDLRARSEILEKVRTKTGLVMGDTTKGGRDATLEELGTLAGFHHNGVPKGLDLCPTCGEWLGTCLDPNTELKGKVMRVYCTCENDSRCAFCGEPFYERKVNANYFDPRSRQIWHVPGFLALKHSCSSVDGQGAPFAAKVKG
jgi:hypothetical protein